MPNGRSSIVTSRHKHLQPAGGPSDSSGIYDNDPLCRDHGYKILDALHRNRSQIPGVETDMDFTNTVKLNVLPVSVAVEQDFSLVTEPELLSPRFVGVVGLIREVGEQNRPAIDTPASERLDRLEVSEPFPLVFEGVTVTRPRVIMVAGDKMFPALQCAEPVSELEEVTHTDVAEDPDYIFIPDDPVPVRDDGRIMSFGVADGGESVFAGDFLSEPA